MPAKNSQKFYVSDGFYHLYNRGVEKRIIFVDHQDYAVMLSYLKEYLSPKPEKELRNQLLDPFLSPSEKQKIMYAIQRNNFLKEITLITYALMPNHFHLLIKQHQETSMDQFMNSLFTRYTSYFNKKYARVGPLFQGVYKAVRVLSDEQLLHLSRYIHKNHLALKGVTFKTLSEQYNSYAEYLDLRKTPWINSKVILDYFSKKDPSGSYRSFVEMTKTNIEIISTLSIDTI